MSRIPSSAMKKASSNDDQQMQQGQPEQAEGSRWSQMSQQMTDGATRIVDRARNNPGKALAIGAGVIAAAAVPLFRWSQNDGTTAKATNARKAAAAKKSRGTGARSKKKSG